MPAYKDKKGNSWYAKFNYKTGKGKQNSRPNVGFQQSGRP